jgi:Cohesin domain
MHMTGSAICLGALLGSFVVSTGFAQTSLNLANVPGYPGSTVVVPVGLRQPLSSAVAAQFDVSFNPAKVTAGDPVGTDRLGNHVVKSREIAPGLRRTLVYSLDNAFLTGTNGALLDFPFTVSPQERVGSGPLTPGNILLANADGAALDPVGSSAGTIFVRPVNVEPDGHVQFFLLSTEGQRYAIQATTNLQDWINISTNVSTGGFMDLIDVDAPHYPYRFYRWELLPP